MSEAKPVSQGSAKKPKKLTVKQAKFVKAKSEGKTGVEAARIAYDVVDYNTANVIASENLQKPTIQQALEAEYEKQGLTMSAIVKPIADGVKANRVVQVEGDFFETEVPDLPTRITAAKVAAMWLGVGKEQIVSGGVHFHQHTEGKREGYDF